MKLKNKISLIILVVWATMATLFYFGSQRIILQGYEKLEQQNTIDGLNRTTAALQQILQSLQQNVKDWAIWDESYRFITDRNQAFIKSTLTTSSFQSIGIDIVLFYNANGKLVQATAVDRDKSEFTKPPDGLLEALTPNSIVVTQTTPDSGMTGLLSIPSGILMIGSHAIIDSEGKGPVRGTLVMAKFLTNAIIKDVEKVAGTNITLYRIPQTINNPVISSIYKTMLTRTNEYIQPHNSYINGYRFLTGVTNSNIAILEIISPRKIYAIGLETIRYSNFIVLLYSIILTVLLWLMLQFLIVRRIEKLTHRISDDKEIKYLPKSLASLVDEVTSVETLIHEASHDPLTGLANRSMLNRNFQHLTTHNHDASKKIVMMYIDIDHFKRINDTMGRDIGDQILIATAKRLLSSLRDADMAARLGSNEFVVMLTEIDQEQIEPITNRIFKNINRPLTIDHHDIYISCSMGVCIYPDDGDNIDILIKQADVALNHAKETGRNHYQFYSHALHELILESHQKEIELQTALDEKQLLLYYQPIFNLRTKQIVSMEALIRWQHPTRGLLGPEDIIPLAEHTNLIYPIGEWVLNTACKQIKEWQSKGLPVVPVAVNVSSAQMKQDSLSETIINALHASGLDSHLLQIEITETGFIDINPKLLKDLEGLRASGIKLTIDDFGTGYAGLGYLKSLPVHKLKIDQSFIRDIQTDPDDKAITLAIIAIAHQLNLEVTAEGVENIEQYNFMCYHQVDEVQGYFLSRPLTVEECEKLLSGSQPSSEPSQK